MYASANTPPDAAASSFIDLTELYRAKFLTEDATVWVNADAPELGIWALTDRSSYVKVCRNAYAGWLRLTRSNVRWARSINDTVRSSSTILDVQTLPFAPKSPVTLAVLHREHDNRVRVVANGKIQHPNSRGVINFDPFSVVDLNHYIPPDSASMANAYEAAHAMINGVALMASTSTDKGAFIRANMDLFRLDFHQGHLDFLGTHWNKMEEYAKLQTQLLIGKIVDTGASGKWADAAAAPRSTSGPKPPRSPLAL